VNDGFGIGIEGFIGASGQLNTMVDICAGLIFGEAMELASDGDAIDDVGMNGLFQGDSQGLLSAKDDFKGELGIDAGAGKQSYIRKGLRRDEVSLIEDEKDFGVGFSDFIQNEVKESVFTDFGRFAQFDDDLPEQCIGADRSQREVDDLIAVWGQVLGKASQEGRFSHTGLTEQKSDVSLVLKKS
jgi:hypothetical protein